MKSVLAGAAALKEGEDETLKAAEAIDKNKPKKASSDFM
jgi:hypothetical protein